MYSGNYCNNCLKGDLFLGDVKVPMKQKTTAADLKGFSKQRRMAFTLWNIPSRPRDIYIFVL